MAISPGKSRGGIEAALRWIGDLDHPFYNDERQRFVWYEASTIGFHLVLVLQLTIGPLAALFVSGSDARLLALLSAPALIGALVVVGYAASKNAPYAGRRDDLVRPRTYLLVIPAVFFSIAVATLGGGSTDSSGAVWLLAGVLIAAFVIGLVVGTVAAATDAADDLVPAPARQTNPDLPGPTRVLRWIGDLDHPFYDEERQRFVWYESAAIGFQLILVLQLAISSIAILVLGFESLPAVVLGIAPALIVAVIVTGYAQNRGAQYFPRVSDVKRTRGLLGFALLGLYLLAMLRLAFDTPADADGFLAGFSTTAPIGFAVGIAVVAVGAWRGKRRDAVEELDEI